MPRVEFLKPSDLAKLSELVGGRKVRSFAYYHSKAYATTGHTSLEFFRVDGKQTNYSGTITTVGDVSNMITSGKFDEPFLIQKIGVHMDISPGANDAATDASDVVKVLSSGRLVLEINNTPVFEAAPIGYCGVVLPFNYAVATTATSVTYAYANGIKAPVMLEPWIFCEEGITVRAEMQWSTAVTITTATWVGVYLIGSKYFKS